MPIDVRTSIVIDRPRAEVAAFAADPDNAPRWYANIHDVRWATPRPLAVGSRVAFAARFLGRRLVYTYAVEELVPGERLVMATAEGPFPMRTTYRWDDAAGGGTAMELRNQGGPSGLAALAAPVIAAGVRRATVKDLRRLKDLLERGPGTPG